MILLLNQNELLTEAIKAVADGDSVTVARTLPYAVELATGGKYDVAIVDPRQHQQAVYSLSKLLPVVVLTESLDGRDAHNAMKDGAVAYLHTSCRVKDLQDAVERARKGSKTMDARVVAQVIAGLERLQTRSSIEIAQARLSYRQVQVLKLLAQGMGNRGIAEAAGLDEGYVQTIVAGLYAKLGVGRGKGDNPRVAAAAWAWRRGLMGGEDKQD